MLPSNQNQQHSPSQNTGLHSPNISLQPSAFYPAQSRQPQQELSQQDNNEDEDTEAELNMERLQEIIQLHEQQQEEKKKQQEALKRLSHQTEEKSGKKKEVDFSSSLAVPKSSSLTGKMQNAINQKLQQQKSPRSIMKNKNNINGSFSSQTSPEKKSVVHKHRIQKEEDLVSPRLRKKQVSYEDQKDSDHDRRDSHQNSLGSSPDQKSPLKVEISNSINKQRRSSAHPIKGQNLIQQNAKLNRQLTKQKLSQIPQEDSSQEESNQDRSPNSRVRRQTYNPSSQDNPDSATLSKVKLSQINSRKSVMPDPKESQLQKRPTFMKVLKKQQDEQEKQLDIQRQQDRDMILKSIEEIGQRRKLRDNVGRKIQNHLEKYRQVVGDIVKNQDLLENKIILWEADQIGIQKKYVSLKNEKRKNHGLALYFYMRRRLFESQYQDFLILVRKANFTQAYNECCKQTFQSAYDYQIKNMLVFEEFFKKNEFEIPKKLLKNYPCQEFEDQRNSKYDVADYQDNLSKGLQRRKTLGLPNLTDNHASSNTHYISGSRKIDHTFYRIGYSIKKDYLFEFIKKMIMLSSLDENERQLIEQIKENHQEGRVYMQAALEKFSQDIREKHEKNHIEEKKYQMEIKIQHFMALEFQQKFEGKNGILNEREFGIHQKNRSLGGAGASMLNETMRSVQGGLQSEKSPLKKENQQPLSSNRQNLVFPQQIDKQFEYDHIPASVHFHQESKISSNASVNELSHQYNSIHYYKKSLHDQKSFYCKKVLNNILKHEFYNKDDESILLALFLLCHQEKRPDECIRIILENKGSFMEKLGKFQNSEDQQMPLNKLDTQSQRQNREQNAAMNRETYSIVDELVDKMSDYDVIKRVVRLAIKLNEPEIAIMAGKELVSEAEDNRKILDYPSLITYLQFFFQNDRLKIQEQKKSLKMMRRSIINPIHLIKLGQPASEKDLSKEFSAELSDEQKKLQYLESNRRWIIQERSLELKERLKIQEKKNVLKTLKQYLEYFISTEHLIEPITYQDFVKNKDEIMKSQKRSLNRNVSSTKNFLNAVTSPQNHHSHHHLSIPSHQNSPASQNKRMSYASGASFFKKQKGEEYKKGQGASDPDILQIDPNQYDKLCFLTVMKRSLEIKNSLESNQIVGFEIEYFLRKLLKWEMRFYRQRQVLEENINLYCADIIIESVKYNKPIIAEMVLNQRKKIINVESVAIMSDEQQSKILNDDQCKEVFIMLLQNPNCEKLELMMEILQQNKSSKKVLKSIYQYIVASDDDQNTSSIISQKKSLLVEGKFIYYCAEILAQTDVKDLEHHFSKEIVLNLAKFSVNQKVLDLALCFQKSIKNEKKFKFIHQMKDLRNREVLDIIVENQFYILLQNDDIGMIAEDLWRGYPAVSVWNASSIKKFIQLEVFDDQILLFKPMNPNQRYIFQFDNWKQSCMHRYIAEAFSIFILAIFYQIIVYIQIDDNSLDDNYRDSEILIVQTLAYIWIYSAFFSQFMQLIYSIKAKKKFQVDWFRFIDFLLSVMCIIDQLQIQLYFYPPQDGEVPYTSIVVPLSTDPNPADAYTLITDSVYYRHILKTSIISSIIFLVWIRIISVLITTQKLGHMIQAIYFMIKMTLNFLIIFACWLICCSAIFTAIYYDSGSSEGNYSSFLITLTSLFSATLAVYDDNFTILEPLGSILMSIFVIISAVMLINLLIALLTEAFSEISKQADSRHRSVLINYRHRWGWNSTQSYLIFVPPPLNILAVPLIPFGFFLKQSYMVILNTWFCKVMFFIVYVIPMIFVFILFNLLIMVAAWLKGFYTIKSILFLNRPFLNLFLWTIFGLFILLGVILKDSFYIIQISIESLSFRRTKKGKLMLAMEIQKIRGKRKRESEIYTNFIKSVINLFDEFDFQQDGSIHERRDRRKSLFNSSITRQSLNQQNNKNKSDKSNKQLMQEKLIEVRIFASRFYRLLEDKEQNKRDVKNPARALKGKRKKRPKIFQNFIQENSKEVQVDLMQCYFFKKYRYNSKQVFDRAYNADFNAIDKAIHKFRQRSALQKQGQNLKKINGASQEIKDLLNEFNTKGNLKNISERLISVMNDKIQEAYRKEEQRKLRMERNKEMADSDSVDLSNEDDRGRNYPISSDNQSDDDDESQSNQDLNETSLLKTDNENESPKSKDGDEKPLAKQKKKKVQKDSSQTDSQDIDALKQSASNESNSNTDESSDDALNRDSDEEVQKEVEKLREKISDVKKPAIDHPPPLNLSKEGSIQVNTQSMFQNNLLSKI